MHGPDSATIITASASEARQARELKKRRGHFLELTRHFGGVSFSGAVACSFTHCLVLPLDVIKTKVQSDAHAAAGGTLAAASAVLRDASGKGVLRMASFFNGVKPTAFGYFLQGATKFGGYELFKQKAFDLLRETRGEEAVRRLQLPVMLASAATAEMAATVLLAPMEVLKLRLQTDPAAAAQGMVGTLRHILRQEGVSALYKGLGPIALRQLPYTVTKLVAYELCSRAAEQAVRRSDNSKLKPLATVVAGLVAGGAAAIVSHPADLLLTRLCGSPGLASNVAECVIAPGLMEQIKYLTSLSLRDAYAGLGPRLAMTSAMTSIQFTIYESTRLALGVHKRPPPPKAVVLPA